MANKKTTEKLAVKTTKNGNKLFDGSEGNTFTSDNQPTPEQKKAGWDRKRARDEFVRKIYGKLLTLADKEDLTHREIIDLGKIAVDISGDKKETQDITTNQQTVINVSEKQIANVLKTVKDTTYE